MVRSFKVLAIHKQMYPATNFKDDDVGSVPSGWTDNDGAGCATTVIASLDGHKKVVQMYDNGAGSCNIYRSITQSADQTLELWIGKDDVGANTTFYIYLYEGATRIVNLQFIEDDLKSWNGAGFDNVKLAFASVSILYHLKIVLDDTANTFDAYINGVLEASGLSYENNSTISIDKISLISHVAGSGFKCYADAIGLSSDANYNIGDNIFWRHYKESTDDFESDDIGDQGTSITWIDTTLTTAAVEIVSEFNEHKKILRQIESAGNDWSTHIFATQSTAGWFATWIKSNDCTGISTVYLQEGGNNRILFRLNGDKFQIYTGGAWRDVTGASVPTDNAWYLLYVQWYADDTFDLWIDNVQYEDGTANGTVFTGTGIATVYLSAQTAGAYLYLDAPISSLDGDERGDNRIFDYNSSYTSEDITDDVINVKYKNSIYKWREATLTSKEDYENSEVFFQIYDVNSVLAMEADIKNRIQMGGVRAYPLRDKNQDDLENRSSNVFSVAKIHDPTDSTSMLKVILPNVGEKDGDLILVEGDTKTTTYSPTTANYPDYMMLRDIGDLADSVPIIYANGKCFLDDDKASGTALDVDTSADADKMCSTILVNDLLETINYFEIFGAINPDTGKRFYKIIDNTGDDKKRGWRYVNNAFKSQTDVDAYASALESRITSIKIIQISAQSLGAHNMGATIDYKYVDAVYNVPQGNYYVIHEEIDFDANQNVIILSEGMIEQSKYAATYEKPEEYNNSYAAEIYETDLISLQLQLLPSYGTAAWGTYGVSLPAKEDICSTYFYLDGSFDPSRAVVLHFIFKEGAQAFQTVDGEVDVLKLVTDGSYDADPVESNLNFDAVFTEEAGNYHKSLTITAGDLETDSLYYVAYQNKETSNANATEIYVSAIQLRYYIKRSLS